MIRFNTIIRLETYPQKWKLARIILFAKGDRYPYCLSPYRPISLLSTISELFEKLLLKQVKHSLNNKETISKHQFGFRAQHAIIQEIHRVLNVIDNSLQPKLYWSALFLDVIQVFNKVWHTGQFYKIKVSLPGFTFNILKCW